MNQPEVDPNKISIIGHSEGTTIVPRIAIDNPSKVKNIVLMGAAANNTRDLVYFREITVPLLYAQKVLDHNHNGLLSVQEVSKNPVFNSLIGKNFTLLLTQNITNVNGNLYIVGDWVGKEGLVSNASVASAKHAAQLILNE
jgi:pimeloyl-ACP methyl ester carboxylesterase